jgi:hypothetical protein
MFPLNTYLKLIEDFQKNNMEYQKLLLNYTRATHHTYTNALKASLSGDMHTTKEIYDGYKSEVEKIFDDFLALNISTMESTSTKMHQMAETSNSPPKKGSSFLSYPKEKFKFLPFSYAARMAGLMGAFNVSKASDVTQYVEEQKAPITTRAALQPPQKIHFEDRVELKSELNAKGSILSLLESERSSLELAVKEQEAIVKKNLKEANYDERYQDLISTSSCFMNQVTPEQAKLYGNLSSLVYQIDREKKIGKADTKVTKIERQITLLNQQITIIETWQDTLINSLKTAKDTGQAMNTIRKNIKNVFNVTLEDGSTFKDISSFMLNKIQDLQTEISTFETQKNQENSAYFAEATKVFGHNLFGSNYEIQGIFHRNNGEFSGLAAYDKDKGELVLSFAGSKSSGDWIKNLFGWNAKLSAKHGLLTNISFHSGFGSHLDDNADSFFSFMHSWMRNYQKSGEARKLRIVGTGHSLGGALAEIFTAATKQLADKHKVDAEVGVMTFGAPSTVNSNCLDTYTNILGGAGNVIRFAHSYDLVPKLIFWKTAPGAVRIEGDNSLFSDVNGTLVLPIRVNPHSSDDYYHSAETVFKQWKSGFTHLQRQVSILSALQEKTKEKTAEIREVSKEAHQLLGKLANQDQNSADVFEDEYREYQKKIEGEFESLQAELGILLNKMQPLETKTLSRQEQVQLSKEARLLKDKIGKKKKMLKELSQDKAWQPYIALMDQEFENLQKSLLRLNSR